MPASINIGFNFGVSCHLLVRNAKSSHSKVLKDRFTSFQVHNTHMPVCTLKELSAAVIIPHVLLALKWHNYTKSIVLFLSKLMRLQQVKVKLPWCLPNVSVKYKMYSTNAYVNIELDLKKTEPMLLMTKK